jgi:WD40 repeat protein
MPGADPVARLAGELTREAKDLQLDWTVGWVRDQLERANGLGTLVEELLLAAPGRGHDVLMVIDQAEELLTIAPAPARAQFVRLLGPALAGPLQVVGTIRPEFVSQLLATPELADLPAPTFQLRPLRPDALASVIEGPATVADITVDPELVDRLVHDTVSGLALPLLAFTLEQLADGVGRGGQLSLARYNQLNGVQGALIRQADAALAEASARTNRTPDQVIAGLLRLVVLDEEGHPIRWPVEQNELPVEVQAELEVFTDRRLLTAGRAEQGGLVIEVTHEAFLTSWPPLLAAIEATRAALRARRAVELAAAEWDDAGRPSIRLWERDQLAAAVADTGARRAAQPANRVPSAQPRSKWSQLAGQLTRPRALVTGKVELSPRARDFLYRSIRKDRSRRRRTVTVLSVLLVLAVIAAGFALVQQRAAVAHERAAQQQLRIATARQLITEAGPSLGDDPFEALQLGIAAQGIEDNAETRASLVTSLISTPYAATLTGHNDLVAGLAFSPNGRVLASCSDDDTWRLWDFHDLSRPTPLGEPIQERADVNSVAFTPDGSIIALGLADKTVHLWSIREPTHPVSLGLPVRAHNGEVRGVGFADMTTLVTAGEDGLVRLWDLANPMQLSPIGQPLSGHRGIAIRSLAITADGKMAATGDVDAFVRLWSLDRNDLRPLGAALKGHTRGMLRSLAFSPDGRSMISVSDDRSVRVWNVANPSQATTIGPPLTGHQDEVTSVAVSPKELLAVTGSDDQLVRQWNLDPARPTARGRPLTGAHDEVYSVAFTSDGSLLAAGAADGEIILWNVAEGTLPAPLGSPLVGHEAGVDPVVFSPTGDLLASASEDATVRLWQLEPDRRTRSVVAELPHEDEVASAAFSSDGSMLVTGSEGTIYFWDVANPRHSTRVGGPLVAHAQAVVSLRFCPGKDLLVSGDEGGSVRLWQMTDPKRPTALGSPLEGNDDAVDSVACSPDGDLLAVAGTGMVKLWDIAGQTPVPRGALTAGHGQAVNSVTFSPDGEMIAAAADDGLVTLWDVKQSANATQLGPPLRAHGDPVTSVAFGPKDARTLATSSDDKTVRLWDLTMRELPVPLGPPLEGHQEAVNSVAIGASGLMASASDDGTVRLWDLAKLDSIRQDPIAYACGRTGRGFNPDEWKSQIPALPYQKTCPR